MKIAVVHNGSREGVINRFGRWSPEKYSVRQVKQVADGLEEMGHDVSVVEADKHLLAALEQWMPADFDGRPSGMVFNMSYGIQGDCRYTHLPAMLEMAGVPYTGSSPMGHVLALDKVITKQLLLQLGIPTPAFGVMSQPGETPSGLRFPLVVKPRHESTSYGLRLVQNPIELGEAVAEIVERYQQAALVEEYVDGREVCIGILGNDPPECLPAVELDFGGRDLKLMTWDDKYHKRMDEPTKVCPAILDEGLLETLNEISVATFRACHLLDYARVDIRIDETGKPWVLEVNSMASLGGGGSFVTAAKAQGYTMNTLVDRIVELARCRYETREQGMPAALLA